MITEDHPQGPPGLRKEPARSGVLPMLASSACFALMNLFVRWTGRIPVQEQILFRALVTLVIIGVSLRLQGVSLRGGNRKLLIARGLAGTIALLAYFWTLQRMPLATAVTLQHLSPVFTILISAALLGERPRAVQLPFFALAFLGVILVRGPETQVEVLDVAIGVLSALFAGLAYNLVRMLRSTDAPEVVVFWFPLVSLPIVGPWSVATWVTPSPREVFGLLMVGLLTTAGQVFLSIGYQRSQAREVSFLNYLGIIYAMFLGWFVFHETPALHTLAGAALIIVGLVVSTRIARRP